MPGPTTGILDSFTRADETPIGGNWTNKLYSADANCDLFSNQIASNGSASDSTAYWNVTTFNADQEVFATGVSGTGYQILSLRGQNMGTGTAAYYIVGVRSVTGAFAIYKRISGTFTQLDTDTGTMHANDKYGAMAAGTTISSWQDTGGGWAQVNSIVNSDVSGAGYIGIEFASGGASHAFIADDFGGGNSGGGGGAPSAVIVGRKLKGMIYA